MKKIILFAGVVSLAGMSSGAALSHSGGLNAEGCHNDRRNGGYHCHRSGSPSRPAARTTYQGLTRDATPRPMVGAGMGVGNRPRYYANCSEARAAGAAPILRGEQGYGPHLDRDGDGVACER